MDWWWLRPKSPRWVGHRPPRGFLVLPGGPGVAQAQQRNAGERGGRDVGVRIPAAVAPASVVVLGGHEPVQRPAQVRLRRLRFTKIPALHQHGLTRERVGVVVKNDARTTLSVFIRVHLWLLF